MKTIEFLFPEFSNLYADKMNVEYLLKCSEKIKVVYTSPGSEPYFNKHKVDMIYMGSMSDYRLKEAVRLLYPYKNKINELIEKNIIFLITGNALEIFGSYIVDKNDKIDCLGIFDYYSEKDMSKKHASWFIGDFENITIIGHRNQFGKVLNINNKFIKKLGGYGIDFDGSNEGVNLNNFYGTYLLGPFLIMNPVFTKYLLRKLSLPDKLFEEHDIMKAYERRVSHFCQNDVRFDMGQYG